MTLTEIRPMPVDIGIDEEDRREVADALSRLVADSYTVYLKTHNFHWNVAGPMRIRALGFRAPGRGDRSERALRVPSSREGR